jgi:hypothetical protein
MSNWIPFFAAFIIQVLCEWFRLSGWVEIAKLITGMGICYMCIDIYEQIKKANRPE